MAAMTEQQEADLGTRGYAADHAAAGLHEWFIRNRAEGSRLIGDVLSVRFVSAMVAVIHGLVEILMPVGVNPLPVRRWMQTLVASRSQGSWRVVAFHNTRMAKWEDVI